MLNRNEKVLYQVIYSVRYILRSVEHEVLRYIQIKLNKLNITHVMLLKFYNSDTNRKYNPRDASKVLQ